MVVDDQHRAHAVMVAHAGSPAIVASTEPVVRQDAGRTPS
jgi:hypothetical protein